MICIDCRYLRERPSGMSPMIQALVDYLPALAPDLRFLFLRHPKAPAPLSSAPNVEERVVSYEANGPATLLFLPRVVDLKRVSLFHATFNILPVGLTMPTVVTVCDVMWLKYPAWARSPGVWGRFETAFYQQGIRHALRHATRITAISEATKREIGTIDRAAEARTSVAHEGVSSAFHPLEGKEGRALIERVREKWVPGAAQYVFTVGQFAPYKNHVAVLRAFARAFRDRPGVHLALVQRLGAGSAVLEPLARAEGIEGRVHFLRNVPFDELVALYNGALALCHPSLYEGFGNPPAEALASGCPVVTSSCSSMPEVSADAALYVDPRDIPSIADALLRIADEPGLAASMRAKGLRRAAQLTWKAYAEGNLAVYRETLAQGRKSAALR